MKNTKSGKKGRSIFEVNKKYISLIISFIFIAFLLGFTLSFLELNRDYNESRLINILGKQRILTQVMAKDSASIYELHFAIEQFKDDKQEKLDLQNKLKGAKNDLEQSRNTYGMQYETIKKGYVAIENKKISFQNTLEELNPVIEKHEAIWNGFNSSIDVILNEKSNTKELDKAVKYINENNEKLLEYSNDINDIISSYNINKSLRMFYITIFLAVFILLSLIIVFINAYKNLLMPIKQLYKGMEQMGIANLDTIAPISQNGELIPIYREVRTVFDKLNSLKMLIENLNKNVPFKHILNYIFESFIDYIPYTYIGIALIGDGGKTIKASYGIAGKHHKNLAKRLLGFKVGINGTSLGKIIETGKERIINDLEEYVKGKPKKEYNRILLEEGIRSSITLPLKNEKGVVGIIFFSSNTKNVYKKEHVRFLKTLANSIMLSLEKDILIDDLIVSSTLALAMLTEERDPETGDHLNRMKIYSKLIAEFLSNEKKYKGIIDVDYVNNIERFSPLHDIGKVAIKDDILLKPGKLTDDEFEIMKTHAIYGAKVLKMADENLKKKGRSVFKLGIEIAEGHHEKWDGSGYPYGKKGEDIPLSARIVAIADVFDALTSKRPYKKAFSFQESIQIIIDGAGKHFDPNIVNIVLENIEIIKETYEQFQLNKLSMNSLNTI